MGAPNKKASHLSGETIALWAVLAVVMIGAGSTAGAIHLGSKVAGDDQQLPKNPAELLVGLIKGTVTWPAPTTWILIGFGVILAALAVLITRAVLKSKSKRSRVDAAARYMATPKDLKAQTLRGATEKAKSLGVEGSPGIPVGKTVIGKQMVFGPGRTCTSTSGGDPERVKPPLAPSRPSCPRLAPSWSPRTSATSSTAPATSAQLTARCGSLTRRPWPWKSPPGGGTRCPTSPTKSGPPGWLITSRPAHAGREPRQTRTSTLQDRTC